MTDFFETMDMPTPCEHCGETFDLNDGFGSEKWHPNIVICEKCYLIEEKEIEEDERLFDLNIEVSNALYEVQFKELNEENQTTIKELLNVSEPKKKVFHFDYIGEVTRDENNMRTGSLEIEPITAWDEEHATLLFKEKHPDTPFDPPY